ncbi:hypothetical protein N7520_005322 [Penicillium odoratum]|uniref:uncharacterized protein n=1 Tax=Penicillium odoratum TaxID=1167516 RepID=UPI0025496173|nr:uncharacterized protein N7520_005322 [Penicillium odoratum]KAJ5765763.1 hypothetical protein N7520_005322 [Penicillium odoratum]
MAYSVANQLSSPPPAYLRDSPPLSHHTKETPRTIPRPQSLTLIRPGSFTDDESPIVQNSPRSPVKIDSGVQLPQASSVVVENIPHNGTPRIELPEFAHMSLGESTPPHNWDANYSQTNSQAYPSSYGPPSNGSWSAGETPKDAQDSVKKSDSSRGSWESVALASDAYEPLAYHHQQEQVTQGAKRSTLGMNLTEQPSGSTGNLAVQHSRIARPLSTYSSGSDGVAAHRRNLSASPYMHGRSSSRNSTASPTVSHLDLLNTSYPQPGPSVAQFDNSRLQASVGNNASLLSHKQTFEMYLANVKKTDSPSVQYEFAVFMINSMREMPNVDLEDSESITRSRLLRESKSILQRLADRSYPFAQYYLGDGYASGLFSKGKPDHDRAFSLFVAASKHGHVEACYRAALCYEFGWGTRPDGSRAVQFYRQAASKNHPGAMSRMARACLAGDMGLGKRYREGIKWMKRATESSDTQYNSAPYELGLLHETGDGNDVFKDESYAAQLFTKSAELGHVEAAYRLGDAYEHGKLNCPRDPALSIHFYTAAAQHGHPLAMMALCAWYMVGAEPVLEKDEDEAYEWATRAAHLGEYHFLQSTKTRSLLICLGLVKAQYAVGYFTEMGLGCRRDVLEANVWYVKAAEQGDERAKIRLAAIQAASEGANAAMATRNGRFKNEKPPAHGQSQQQCKVG